MKKNILVIDNYDSFTYNLVHLAGEIKNIELSVFRNDKITIEEIKSLSPHSIILSPGPCTPNEAGICLDLIKQLKNIFPIFGVCLGMQAIGQAFGAKIINAPTLMHGKTSIITHEKEDIFQGIKNNFTATRYHSLIVEKQTLPNELKIIAKTQDNMIMGLAHKKYPIFGVQFHPESIASQFGLEILSNFVKIADKFNLEKQNEHKVST